MPKNFKDFVNQDNKTAYELTKLYCQFSIDQGKGIPTLAEIQKELGRGSARDIYKARNDFSEEQNEFIKKVEELSIDDLPWVLIRKTKEAWIIANEIAAEQQKKDLSLAHEQIKALKIENKKLKKELGLLKKQK